MSSSTAQVGALNTPSPTPPGLFPLFDQDDSRLRRFELINTLQATLELPEQLGIFFNWLQQLVTIDGLSYNNRQHQISLNLGSEASHRCNYQLKTDQDMLGELEFCRRHRFTEEELSQIESALTALLYPIRNALRYHVAVQTALRDPLTGTGNRIALDNALHRECQLAERYNQSVSLLVLDIDYFKKINDNHGHSVGDEVLQQIAARVQVVTRETDMTFRYGGEEFVVVLSKTDLEGAAIIGERVRQIIEHEAFTTQAGDLTVTVSVGASHLRKNETIKQLFDRADEALYVAKNQGRNCVISL